jgi:ArsR family transcriptional regulator
MRRARNVDALTRHSEEAAAMLRALSHGGRLKVLCELVLGERSAGDLVRAAGLSQSALSQHLAKLREEGIVETRRDAQSIYYRLCDPRVAEILKVLHGLYCDPSKRGAEG